MSFWTSVKGKLQHFNQKSMARLIPLLLLASLALTACGEGLEDDTDSSLEGMLNQDSTSEEDVSEDPNPEETPYSVGPTEIPDDLIPNE